jgi:hypothetical protein
MREQDDQEAEVEQRVVAQFVPVPVPKPLFPIVMGDGRLEVPAAAIVHGR